MGIIYTLLIGFFVGLVAKFLHSGKDPSGCLSTIIIGLVGSFIGTYLGQLFGLYHVGEPAGFIGSVIGAMILLAIFRLVKRR